MLKQRVLTAAVLIAILLVVLFLLPQRVFTLFTIFVFALAAWEWANLSSLTQAVARVIYAVVLAALCLASVHFSGLCQEQSASGQPDFYLLRDIFAVGCAWWALALLWVMSYPASAVLWGYKFVRLMMGVLVLVPAATALIYVTGFENGQWLFLYIVSIVIAADTGAYFAGTAFGKRKLAPNVSPGKSWAGFFGGLFSCAVLALIAGSFFTIGNLSFIALLSVTLITALASVLGDLLESMVKRHRGIKDSSQLLPGHGGILDRIDSMTAAAPVFCLLLLLLQAQAV